MTRERWFVDGFDLRTCASDITVIPDGEVPKRGEDLEVARRDGLVWQRKFYGARLMAVTMCVKDRDEFGRQSPAVYRANVDGLKRAWHKPTPVEIRRITELPEDRVLSRKLTGEALQGFAVETPQGFSFGTFTVELTCADPWWWEEPKTLTGKAGTFRVYNPGTVQTSRIRVRLYGPAVDPTLTCEPAGTVTTWQGTLGAGEWIDVDADAYTVVDQGGTSAAGALARTSHELAAVAPGYNAVTLSDGTCDFVWEAGYL